MVNNSQILNLKNLFQKQAFLILFPQDSEMLFIFTYNNKKCQKCLWNIWVINITGIFTLGTTKNKVTGLKFRTHAGRNKLHNTYSGFW